MRLSERAGMAGRGGKHAAPGLQPQANTAAVLC